MPARVAVGLSFALNGLLLAIAADSVLTLPRTVARIQRSSAAVVRRSVRARPGVREDEAVPAPRVLITYCTQCRWLLRAQWYAGELLTTFAEELGEVALAPTTGGVFRVEVDGEPVWNRKRDGGFPEITELKRRVRDLVAPERSLGHADRSD